MQILTVKQVAERLQIHPATVLNLIAQGVKCNGSTVRIRASCFGRVYRIRADDLESFIELTSNFLK